MHARTRDGMAIVSVLVIMVAVVSMGTAALLLTNVNLRTAINVRANSEARSYAETGLDAGMIELERHYREQQESTGEGSFPSSLTLPDVSADDFAPSYELVEYDPSVGTSGEALLVVRGDGPRQAEHVTEAIVAALPGDPRLPGFFDYGLASEGVVNTSGTSTYINSGIHGNGGYDLGDNDSFYVCEERNDDGECISFEEVELEDAPVSASPDATTCSPKELCDDDGDPRALTDPVQIESEYEYKRDVAIYESSSDHSDATQSAVFEGWNEDEQQMEFIDCDEHVGSPGSYDWTGVEPGSTICVDSYETIDVPSDTTLEDANLITLGDVNLGQGTVVSNSTLVSMEGRIQAGDSGNDDVTITDSELFSEDGIVLNGSQTSISGRTTLASNGDVTINGGSPAVTDSDGDAAIGLVLISGGDTTVNGSSDWYIASISEGSFTQNGTSTVYGRVASAGDMTFNGGIDIDSGLDIANDGAEVPGPPFTQAVSRR